MAEHHSLQIKVRPHHADRDIRGASVARAHPGFMAAAMAACLSMSPLHAQSKNLDGVVALSSQLVDRGMAITPATPILQGAVSWTSPAGWSLGVSGSTELRSPGRVVEALAHASRYWSLSGDWQVQASALYYRYPGNSRAHAYDRAETGVNWTYRDVFSLGVSAIYVIGAKEHRPRGALDASFHWPLPGRFSVSVGAGVAEATLAPYSPYHYGHKDSYRYADADNGLHGYGHVGLSWSGGHWRMQLERILADPAARRQWDAMGASPWVATISRSF